MDILIRMLAGASGIEPELSVLETDVLPLTLYTFDKYTYRLIPNNVNPD